MKFVFVAVCLIVAVTAFSGCGGGSTDTNTSQGPSPVASSALVTLNGVVRRDENTLPLAGATVRLLDGPKAGLSLVSGSDGTFVFDNIPVGQVTVSAVADGYGEDRAWVYADGKNGIAFHLTRPGRGAGGTFQGLIRTTDPPCQSPGTIHDGKPCQRYGPFEVPTFGSFSALLQWLPGPNEVDYEFWRNGERHSYTTEAIGPQDATFGGIGPGSYEVRVVYMGRGSQNYQMRVYFSW